MNFFTKYFHRRVSASAARAAMRRRAAERERARLGRELHDGVVQALAAIDMDIEVARKRAAAEPQKLVETLERVQTRVRAETVALRVLLQQGADSDVSAAELPEVLDETVWRFKRDTQLGVKLVMNLERSAICLPRRVCSELVRIVREALVNVQRHSGAGRVIVQFSADDQFFTVAVEDDGRGFAVNRTPAVIRARARSIGARVRVLALSRGARLEVTIPREGPWRNAVWFES
jgi:signal transduction histidine kinase